jgi:magnesium-protoporphyrin O-methyltransferase
MPSLHMSGATYEQRRGQIETYFDRTAADAWARLTSTAPVGRIRATVRAGRDEMRATLLGMLPADLQGRRVLDAGCGTGALAIEAAKRGADVVAIDLSPTLIKLAQERLLNEIASEVAPGRISFQVGDMFDTALGEFDHIVAMDSLIHYQQHDVVRVLLGLAARTRRSIVFTFAPSTPALQVMHAVGRLFPRSDRAPAIEPLVAGKLQQRLNSEASMQHWRVNQTQRISRGFYKSQALELRRI